MDTEVVEEPVKLAELPISDPVLQSLKLDCSKELPPESSQEQFEKKWPVSKTIELLLEKDRGPD